VVLVGIGVDGFDFLRSARDSGFDVAVLVADERLLGVETFLQGLGNRRAGDFRMRALIPDDRQRIERGLRLPPGVGHDRDRGVADLQDFLHAGHPGDLGAVEALHLAAEHRRLLDRGVEHSGEPEVAP